MYYQLLVKFFYFNAVIRFKVYLLFISIGNLKL